MKYLSLFSGYGGFEKGIQQAYDNLRPIQQNIPKESETMHGIENKLQQWECVGFSEIDKYAIQTYLKHYPTHKNYGDIKTIDPKELPDFDLLVGGFPCQAFSIAGKRMGFEDTRGTLIYDVFRIIKEKHPKFVLLENVKGLLSHDSGRTFKTIITSLAELGYAVEWQVLNAKNFGVPQNRERVFIIGHLGGFSGRQVFPITGNDKQTNIEGLSTVSAVTGVKSVCVCPTLDTMYKKGLGSKQARPCILQINQPKHSNDRVYSEDGISPTLNTAQGGNRQPFIPVLTPDRLFKRQNGRRFKEDGDPMFTLNTQDKHGIYDGCKIRRLTPTECERLMGLPDGWTEGVSDTQRYKLCGNGVVVNVVEEIIKKIYENKNKNSLR
ncbi:MAG: DNA (cytosine-5-)-methyltransferase [Methanolobus sp.]|nr:DNA (cytosine-5-)-methyltransferase [Methanolobus sp.]